MKNMARASRRILTACLLAAVLSGCFGHSRPIAFYALSSMPRPAGTTSGAPGTVVAVYPAVIPAAIDRPQLVTRADDNQIALSEFNRWGGTLKDEISRVLRENLGILLAERRVTVMSDNLALDPAYFVAVTFNRFDGRLGDSAWLNAAWTIRDPRNKKTLAMKTSIIEEKALGPGYAELVAAQSRVLETLSREIAGELSALLKTL